MWISYAALSTWAIVEAFSATHLRISEPLPQASVNASPSAKAPAATSARAVAGTASLTAAPAVVSNALSATTAELIDGDQPGPATTAIFSAPVESPGAMGSRLLCSCRDGRCECPRVSRKRVTEPQGRSM